MKKSPIYSRRLILGSSLLLMFQGAEIQAAQSSTPPSQCNPNEPGVNVIIGTPGDDILRGTNGKDVILGLAGNDTLRGLGGDDCMDGGAGNDRIIGDNGNDRLYGGEGDDNLIGRKGDDFLDGGTGNDVLRGNQGNDSLSGGDGRDILLGKQGDDILDGGPGRDRIDGDQGNDICRTDSQDDRVENCTKETSPPPAENHPPVIAAISGQTVEEGESLTVTITATDPDNSDVVTLTATNLPGGATFTPSTNGQATFSWTPGAGTAGTYQVTITATDDGNPAASDQEILDILVKAPQGTSDSPVITLRSTTSDNRTSNGFLIYGTASDDGQVVRVTGKLATTAGGMLLQRDLDVSANGAWAFMIPPGQLQAGDEAVVTIEAEDDDGQVTTEVLNFPVVDPAEGILHKLSRVTFGVTPELLEEVRDIGWDAYLQQQLHPETIDDSEAEQGAPSLPLPKAGPWLQDYPLYWIFHSKRHLNEVMAWFWENHFNTSKGKSFAGLEERENQAFREHALDKFRNILEISAKSPAMIQYLDTQHSKRGAINENYARELMELHTLGVDGGYTHEDIVNVARAFTGWFFSPGEGKTVFVPAWHDTDEKVVLGHVLPAGQGVKDAEAVLDILASHPATARRICTKLARVFMSDQPHTATIDDCAAVFQATDGDIRQVVENLLTSAEFHEASRFHAKFKTPLEYLTSAVRALQPVQIGERDLIGSLKNMEQQLFYQNRPTGWAETADKWLNSSQVVQRLRFANQLALRKPKPNQPQNTFLKPVEYFSGLGLETTEGIVGHLFQILTAGDYTQTEWDTAVAYLQPGPASQPFSLQQDDADRKLREMIAFILSLPGTQLQ